MGKNTLKIGLCAVLAVFLGLGVLAPAARAEYGGARELADGTKLTQTGLEETSPDGTLAVQILEDAQGRFAYTVTKNGRTALRPSQLGLETQEDLTQGLRVVEGSEKHASGTETYTLTSGANRAVSDPYRELTFDLERGGERLRVTLRVFNGGVAYRYTLFGQPGRKVSVTGEASEYLLPHDAVIWAGDPDVNYEFDFTKRTMEAIRDMSGNLSVPVLACDGQTWVLICEAAVYNDPDPYCASLLTTQGGSESLRVQFGNGQTGPVEKTFLEDGTVSTPWRAAAVADNLNDIVNATIFTSLNPDPDPELYADTSYIRPGKAAWSWWSESGDDPVEYDQQKDYIDFAAANGWEYVCIDFGWCLWEDYQTKVKELADYARSRGVGIMLWYGVNNDNHSAFRDAQGNAAYPKYSLKTAEQMEEQFAWCREVGVSAVKVDYYENDNQFTMRQMYECATIAAKNKINVLFHGCTVPRGEQRTFPNVLGYEAVRGAEWYKWNVGPSTATELTYLFTRNVLGGMDYTPPAMQVEQSGATAGFRLAQTVAYESGLPSFASSVFKLEGCGGLPLLNDVPVSWDETRLLDGCPGEYLAVARRCGDSWYVSAMTAAAREEQLNLGFLGEGEYNVHIFRDNEDGSGIEVETSTARRGDTLSLRLKAGGGAVVRIARSDMDLTTPYDGMDYYEAEDEANLLTGGAAVVKNQFVSGMKRVGGIGLGEGNTLTFTGVTVPEDGVYELRLYYSTGVERRICIGVNGGEPIRTGKLCCGVNALSARSFYVELRAGENTITFSNPQAKAPDVDRIAISRNPTDKAPTPTDDTDDGQGSVDGPQYDYTAYDPYEASLAGGARVENGGIGWLGNGPSCTAVFPVTVGDSGTYKLRVCYYTGETRNLQVRVGQGDPQTVSCPNTGSYTTESADYIYLDVALEAGENRITLFNASGWAPNILEIAVSVAPIDKSGAQEPEEPGGTSPDTPPESPSDRTPGTSWPVFASAAAALAALIAGAAVVIVKHRKNGRKGS